MTAISLGRIITPGTPHQLGRLGLFRPSASQRRVLTPATQPIVAKSADSDVLWVGFDQLFGGLASTADFQALAETFTTWVIDDVPSPSARDTASAPSWQRFSTALDVVHDQAVILFLIGQGPLDWKGPLAWDVAGGSALPTDLARIATRLSLLQRLEQDDPVAEEEAAGS